MLFNDQSEKEHAEQAYGSTEEAESRTLFGFFFDCGKGGQGMFLLFFLLWLLLSGGVDLHICLWGLAVSALLTGFCKRVLGYDWRPFFGSPARIWALARYFLHLLLEMLKAGLIIMKIIYTHPKEISPKLVWFRTPLRTDRHRAMLSDSIALTAGTITVRSKDGRLLVHALDTPLAEGIEDTTFQQRLEKLEASQWKQ